MSSTLFYILAAVTILMTILAITEKHPVHAIIYLVTSFFSLALIFYILAAPLVAAFEVIIYAGAIMVLFLFIIMMLQPGTGHETDPAGSRDWLKAAVPAAAILAGAVALAIGVSTTGSSSPLSVRDFARTLFRDYGVAVEIISMQLLFALVGALYLARREK